MRDWLWGRIQSKGSECCLLRVLVQAYKWNDHNSATASSGQLMRPGFISAMSKLNQTTNKQREYLAAVFKLHQMNPHRSRYMRKQLRRDLEVCYWYTESVRRRCQHQRTLSALTRVWFFHQVYNELFFFPPRLRTRAYALSVFVSTLGVAVVAVRHICHSSQVAGCQRVAHPGVAAFRFPSSLCWFCRNCCSHLKPRSWA